MRAWGALGLGTHGSEIIHGSGWRRWYLISVQSFGGRYQTVQICYQRHRYTQSNSRDKVWQKLFSHEGWTLIMLQRESEVLVWTMTITLLLCSPGLLFCVALRAVPFPLRLWCQTHTLEMEPLYGTLCTFGRGETIHGLALAYWTTECWERTCKNIFTIA